MNKQDLIEEIYSMNLQSNTEKTDFDKSFKAGIETTIDELITAGRLNLNEDCSENFYCRPFERGNILIKCSGQCLGCKHR